MSVTTIYAKGSDNILDGVTPTGTAPSSTYSLATLALMQPAARVRWGTGTVSLVFTLGASALGDILVIPAHNVDAGATVLVLSNGSGLSQAITVPADQANGLPSTIAIDLKALVPLDATRTSNVWTLTFTGNTANLTLGGAIAIFGPKRTLSPNIRYEFSVAEVAGRLQTVNDHLTRYIVNMRTAEVQVQAKTRTNSLSTVRDWFLANAAGTSPGLLWVSTLPAYFGIWSNTFDATNVIGKTDEYDVSITFIELSKGKPI